MKPDHRGGCKLRDFVRFQLTQNLFYDNLTDEPIRIRYKGTHSDELTIRLEKDNFIFAGGNPPRTVATMSYSGGGTAGSQPPGGTGLIKFYRFETLDKFDSNQPGALLHPDGRNLFSVVYGSKEMRKWVGDLFSPYGLAAVFRPHERTIELQKQQDGVVTSYSYSMTSDTLQRMLFYHAAIESNKGSVLVFEEPEAHTFPYYTKHLGERIALDVSNQYFIATHNPYLLVAVLEKAARADVAVFATRYRDYQTETTLLDDEQLGQLLEADPFLGLENVLGKD